MLVFEGKTPRKTTSYSHARSLLIQKGQLSAKLDQPLIFQVSVAEL